LVIVINDKNNNPFDIAINYQSRTTAINYQSRTTAINDQSRITAINDKTNNN
jgi:hypothetical protein